MTSTSSATTIDSGIRVLGDHEPAQSTLLTPDALAFLADLHRRFDARRKALLARRSLRQHQIDAGSKPDFLATTRHVRVSDWRVSPVPEELLDRRVEITGPVDRKMVINALNSGAQVFMADFEDSLSPTWPNVLDGQQNLHDAVRRTIAHTDAQSGKSYALGERIAILFVRPRGWHLEERHLLVDGQPMSASLFDFGLYFFHNARELLARGTGPYFYLPKMESHLEARLWNDVFLHAQHRLGIARATIKATVLIETILAAFEMDEILYELREHSAGLNCGRWDYIFSFIKKFRADPAAVMPDRATVTMTQHFLRSYSQLLIRTCHRRGVHAMGGMAAQIPIKHDATANDAALAKVRADKQREATDGHDGTWVAHPALVKVAQEPFDAVLGGRPNQLDASRDDVQVTAADLLRIPSGAITLAGLRQNLNVGLQYLEAWLCGNGCVPLYNLMEDAATAEISRMQVWQWLRHGAALDDGRTITQPLVQDVLQDELAAIERAMPPERWQTRRFALAAQMFLEMVVAEEPPDFLTTAAYAHI
jgi:malate synthase